jgi:hypothetical protein
VKRSPTPTPEDDEQYEDRCHNYEAERNAHRRHMDEILIWRTCMQSEEYNLNQHTWQFDVREAHLHIRERRCDHREIKFLQQSFTYSTLAAGGSRCKSLGQ